MNLPAYCSLSLELLSAGRSVVVPEQTACRGLLPTDNDVLVLQPEEIRSYEIDLAARQWHVLQNGVLTETGALPWNERFRLVYRPPSDAATARLKDAAIIWHGRLPSRAFHGRGNVD